MAGTRFRQWATNVLREFMLRGYSVSQFPHAVHDRYLIVDNDVWLLGTSVKDMGRGLCTIIKLGFTPDDILSRI